MHRGSRPAVLLKQFAPIRIECTAVPDREWDLSAHPAPESEFDQRIAW